MSLCDHYQRPQNELKDASGAKITVVANLTLEERKEFLQKLFRSPTTSLIEPGWAEFVNASGGCRACKKKGRRCETSNGTQVICEACRRDKKKCTFGSFIRFRYAASQLGITLTQALEIFEKELPEINGKKGYMDAALFTQYAELDKLKTSAAKPSSSHSSPHIPVKAANAIAGPSCLHPIKIDIAGISCEGFGRLNMMEMPDFGQNEHQLDDNHYSSPNSSLGSPIVRFGTKRKRDVSPSSTVSDSARGGHLPREISDSPPPFLSSFSASSTNASPGNGAHAADNNACSISVSSNVRACQPSGVVHSNPQIDVVGGRSSGSDINNAKRRRQSLEPASSPSCGSGFASRAGLLDGVHVPKVPAQSVIAFLNKKTERLKKESRALDAALASAKEVHLIINDKNEKIAKLKEENEAKKQMLAEFNRLIESSCIE